MPAILTSDRHPSLHFHLDYSGVWDADPDFPYPGQPMTLVQVEWFHAACWEGLRLDILLDGMGAGEEDETTLDIRRELDDLLETARQEV